MVLADLEPVISISKVEDSSASNARKTKHLLHVSEDLYQKSADKFTAGQATVDRKFLNKFQDIFDLHDGDTR